MRRDQLGQHLVMEAVTQCQLQTPPSSKGIMAADFHLKKGHRGTPGNSQSPQPAAGDTHPTSPSPRRDWDRPSLEPGAMERTCL